MRNKRIKTNEQSVKAARRARKRAELREDILFFFQRTGENLAQAGDRLWRLLKNAGTGIRTDVALGAEKRRAARERRHGRPETLLKVMVANGEAGHRFFSADVMAHFGTRLESRLLEGGFFVTSERDGAFRPQCNRAVAPLAEARSYTVRRFDYGTAEIRDVSGLGEYHTREEALAEALELSKNC